MNPKKDKGPFGRLRAGKVKRIKGHLCVTESSSFYVKVFSFY